MNSLIKPESHNLIKSDQKVTEQEREEVKKVRLSVEEKEESSKKDEDPKALEERKRHASSGQQQIKSLYDGLSHLYTDCDSRLRSVPNQNYSEKRSEGGSENPSGTPKVPEERISSPHRMSDSELKEKEEGKKEDLKVEDGDKSKGSSKTNSELHGFLFCMFRLRIDSTMGLKNMMCVLCLVGIIAWRVLVAWLGSYYL